MISSWRLALWRHCRPAAILRFFFSASSPALISRRRPGTSGANDFSMKTFTPFFTAYSNCMGRKAAKLVSMATSPGPEAVDRLLVGVEADELPVLRDVDPIAELAR